MVIQQKNIITLEINSSLLSSIRYRNIYSKNIINRNNKNIISENEFIKRHYNYDFYSYNLLFFDKNNLTEKEQYLFDFFNKKDIDIKENDRISFSKDSKYPRGRLANFTKNKRCNSREKANYIVVSKNAIKDFSKNNLNRYKDQTNSIFKDNNTGKIYFIHKGYYYYDDKNTIEFMYNNFLKGIPKKSTLNGFVIDYYKYVKNINLEFFDVKILGTLISKNEDYLDLLTKYRDKIIFEEDIDSYINKSGEVKELTDDNFDMINKLLKADHNSVSLGLRMLSSFDLDTYYVPIALLFLFNIHKINRNKSSKSVLIHNIKKRLPYISTNNVYDVRSRLKILSRITENATSENDRELVRKYAIPLVKQQMNDYVVSELKHLKFLNKIEVNIE